MAGQRPGGVVLIAILAWIAGVLITVHRPHHLGDPAAKKPTPARDGDPAVQA